MVAGADRAATQGDPARRGAEIAVVEAEREVAEATRRLTVARQERDAFRVAASRRREGGVHYEIVVTDSAGVSDTATAVVGGEPEVARLTREWQKLPRTLAVERALVELVQKYNMPASPADIEAHVAAAGRNDQREHISAALAHLSRTDRAHRVGHAKWMPGVAPKNAESAAVTALSVVPGPTSEGGEAREPHHDHDQESGWDNSHGGDPAVVL